MVIKDDIAIGEMVGKPEVMDRAVRFLGLDESMPVDVDDTDPTDINPFSYEETMSIIASGVETMPVLVEVIDATGVFEAAQAPTPTIGKGDTVSYLKEGSTIPRQWKVRCNPFACRNTGESKVYIGWGSGFCVPVSRLTLVEKAGEKPAKVKTRRTYKRRRAA